uniref:PDZ domain-containing protein n=1 Tax=Mesocestoides corti TaxID=53468 RepID=A0A5K3F7I8_MESCO
MKVTVAFGDMKIVVPCGSGDFSVKELAAKAVFRMKHSLKFSPDLDRVLVHSLSISRDGGILDWDDLVSDVLDDREQLVAQYSIEASLPEPTFSPPSFKRAPPLAPLVFDVSRLNHPISDHDPGSGGVLLGHTQVGHGNAAGSSSSSLSLSSGSLGGGGVGAGGLHRHRLPHQLHEHHPTSSRHPAPSEFSEHHYHQNQHSLSHQRPLSEIDIPPAGLFEDTNKADSGYKSDHTRLFCDVPPRAAGSGRRTVVTPPLPPPIVCDYDKNSIPTTLSQTAPNTVTASATASLEVPASESCLELPFPTTIKPIAEKLSEVLSKRRAHLRNNWDYEKNDYAEDDEEDEDDVDEDDFMEVSDAISGKRTVFVGVAANVSTASAVDASMTASSSGKRSTTAGTDGEGGDFSDEGLSTVRRVVQQPKEPETKPLPGTQASSPLRAFGGQATKTLDPLISFAENTPLKAPATADWTPLQLRQQLTLIDRQRISSPPAIGVPRTIPEEDENLFNQPSSQQNTFKPKTSPADVHCRPRKIIQEEEEEAETEEDYPMLRLDYRLNEGKESHQSNEPNKAGVHTASPLKPNLPPTEPLQNDRPSHRGLTTPAVLQWLESTQAAAASDGGAMSPFTTPSSIVSGASSAAPTSTGACEEESISASQHDLVSRVIRRNVREASEDLRRGFFLAGYESEPVDIHLTNTMPGENLGIQIKPIFTEPTELIPFVGQVPLHLNSNGKCEAGLEVHAIMPNGRVAREGTLAVGDRILSINGTSLMGIPFDKGREIFQEALKNPELVLHVLPYTGRISSPPRLPTTSTAESNFASPPTVPTREVTSTAAASKDEKPSCGLVLVVDQSEKAKEAETLKPGPPPPPRRSPHTALSQQQQQQADDALGTGKPAPILPPRHKPEIVQPQISPSGLVTKTVRLRKGASGLGFSLTSRDQHQRRPNCPVFIKNILPGGAALLDGNLKPGDRLLKVSVCFDGCLRL